MLLLAGGGGGGGGGDDGTALRNVLTCGRQGKSSAFNLVHVGQIIIT